MILLNHHHLYYFWVVAREGSIARACEKLHLAQPTVSAQLGQLEKSLQRKLLAREGRGLKLTDDGRLVLDYADQIFNTTRELLDTLKDQPNRRVLEVQIGIEEQVSKSVAIQALALVYRHFPQARPQVTLSEAASLWRALDSHRLDLALANQDIPVGMSSTLLRREVARVPVWWVAAPRVAAKAKPFPQGLSRVPLLLPAAPSPIRSDVDAWLNHERIMPAIGGEFQDVELLRRLALGGFGAAPLNDLAIREDLRAGRLRRLHGKDLGLRKTLWLVVKRRHRLNPVAEKLLADFSLR